MDKEVVIKITIDGVEQEIKSIDDLKKAVNNLGNETKKTEKETSFFREQLDKAKSMFSDISKNAKGLANDFKGFAQGLGISSKAAKGLSISLAALGIPLLVAALTTAVEYFKNFEGGVKLISTAMNVLNAVIGEFTAGIVKLLSGDLRGFIDSILGLGTAAVDAAKNTDIMFESQKKLAELQEKSIVQNAKLNRELELNKKIIGDGTATYEERVEALKKVEAAETQLIKNKELETQVILENLKAQLALENNYEKRRDLALEIAQVEASLIDTQTQLTIKSGEANKKIRELDNQRTKEAEDAAKKRLEIERKFQDDKVKLAQEIAILEETDERKREELKLEFQKQADEQALQNSAFSAEKKGQLLLQIQEKYGLLEAQLNDKFRLEDEAKQKAIDDKTAADKLAQEEKDTQEALVKKEKADALLEELRLGSIQNAFARAQEEIRIAYEKDKQILLDAGATNEQLAVLDKAYTDGSKALAKEEASYKREQAAGLADSISSLVGESSRVGKIASIASATINTFEGATKAIAQGGFFGIATAAITIAAGLKNIQKIIQTKVPGEGSTPVPASLSGASSSAPSFDPRAALDEAARNSTMINRIGTVNMGAEPIKTYVVASDMTSAQEKQQKIENLSRL